MHMMVLSSKGIQGKSTDMKSYYDFSEVGNS